MVTGQRGATTATTCLQRGAFDFLTKPIAFSDLDTAIDRAIRRRHTLLEDRSISNWAKQEVTRRAAELREEGDRSHAMAIATFKALVTALEAKSDYLRGHSAGVACFAAAMASELGLPEGDIETVRLAGWLHDLGQIGIREAVLNKPGPLTEESTPMYNSMSSSGHKFWRP